MRTTIFIDYQNMYNGAREAFGWENEAGHYGNFKPIVLSRLLTQDPRVLQQVRVYTGVPHPDRDRLGHSIVQRRLAAFVAASPDRVVTCPRTLKYPPPNGREKGVDVQLAVDVVRLAIQNDYDCVVLCSADTDLAPALEFVAEAYPDKLIETIGWDPEPGCEGVTAAPLDIAGGGISRRVVSLAEFRPCIDRTNYTVAARQEMLPGQSGRRLPTHRRRDT